MSGSNLRDYLLSALSSHPGTRALHLHVLVTAPRKSNALFPFATPRPPRAYLHDILLLLSEQPLSPDDAPRVIVSAVEASVYYITATSCAVLYVSKVDSTGQASAPSPTALLVRALLRYYVDPATRPIDAKHVWVQLFARAQPQYLFPNSKDWKGKTPLGDTQLCAWWKRVLTRVALDVEKAATREESEKIAMKMYYILPGYTESEAEHALRIASPPSSVPLPPTGLRWEYGHPYSQTEIPLPCPVDEKTKNLGNYIPYFDDDPKSRFMDEIAHTTDGEIQSPQRKRARTITGEPEEKKEKGKEDHKPLGELGKVSTDEYWERMSFRQECVAGAVTGFFTLIVSCGSLRPSTVSPLAPQPGQISSQLNKRIMTTLLTGVEFSSFERAVKATETLEGAIKGLCEGIPSSSSTVSAGASALAAALMGAGRRTPEREGGYLSVAPRTPPPARTVGLPEVSPNPFPEPVASLDTYCSYIYGSVETRNAVERTAAKREEHVTVLAVRRKKKRPVP